MPSICGALSSYCKAFLIKPKMSESENNHLSLLEKKVTDLLATAESYCAIASYTSLLFQLLNPKDYTVFEKPLLRMLNGPEHYRQLGLNLILSVLERNNTVFERSIRYMRIFIIDTDYCKHKKVEVLKLMANESNIKWIQKELEYWIK